MSVCLQSTPTRSTCGVQVLVHEATGRQYGACFNHLSAAEKDEYLGYTRRLLQSLVERIAPRDPERWEARAPVGGRQVSAARARQLWMTLRQLDRAVGDNSLPRAVKAKTMVASVFSPRTVDAFLEQAVDGRYRDDPRSGRLSWSTRATLRDCLKILGTAAGYDLVLPAVYRERLDLKPPVPAAQRVALYRKLADLAAAGPLERDGIVMTPVERARLLALVAVVIDTATRSGELALMNVADLAEGESAVRVRRRPQNAAHLPEVEEVCPLREGSQVAVRRWLKARSTLFEHVEGGRSALWVSQFPNQWGPGGMPLRPQGIQRAYARGIVVLNGLMAGEYGWEPLPGTLEQLRRSVELERAGSDD